MLFFVSVIILVIGIVAWWYYDSYMCDEWVGAAGAVGTIVGVIAVLSSLVVMACNYIGIDGYISQMNVRHETLAYQYENNIYENDNDLGKRELIVDIQDWNEDLSRKRENQDDFWVGIYMPNIYDQFEFIELEKSDG